MFPTAESAQGLWCSGILKPAHSAVVDPGERLLPGWPYGQNRTALLTRVSLSSHLMLEKRDANTIFFFDAVDSDSQALSMFSAALASGQLGPLMSQFGLPAEAVDAANKGGKYWCCWENDEVVCWGVFVLFVFFFVCH